MSNFQSSSSSAIQDSNQISDVTEVEVVNDSEVLENDEIYDLRRDKRNFEIRPLLKTTCDVWKYYGEIFYKPSDLAISGRKFTDKIYCCQCFNNANEKNPIFKSYSKSTSTTVLSQHLSHEHNYERASTANDCKQRKLAELFFGQPQTKRFKAEKDQLFLNRQFSLWISRDLLPFSIVENEGFKNFFSTLLPKLTIPARSTLSREALDDNYNCFKKKLLSVLETSPKHATIAFDGWTDKFKKFSYITYTYHYIDEDWCMKSIVLKTARFDHPHTAEALKAGFEATLLENNLNDKYILGITDGGANMIKCVKELKIKRSGCVAHSINRLIQHDLMSHPLMTDVVKIIIKLKKAQRKLCFKYTELKEKYEEDRQLKLNEMMAAISNAYELCTLDEQYVDEDVEILEREFEEEVANNRSNFRGLHSSNPIRWSCLQNTINCHLNYQSIIRSSLEKMEAYELILTKDEIETLNGLACVLKPFDELTKIVQGVEYPTINLVALLLTHIEDQLETIRLLSSNVFVKEAIDIILQNLNKRLEMTDEMIAATYLDASLQHLPIIERLLNEKGLTKAQLIQKIVQSWDIKFPEIQEPITESRPQARTSPVGSFIAELISKHTNLSRSQRQSTLESELISFSEIKNIEDNALSFWKKTAKSFPHLAAVAKVLLGIPISTAKAEGAFSTAGCLIRDKRARIDPLRAEKVLFIHDNYFLTK